MHEAPFVGGPLDGLTYEIRSDLGVLVVAKDAQIAWLYRAAEGGDTYELVLDDADPATGARVLDEDKAIAAAEAGYDVIAAPGEEPTQEELDEEEVLTDGE